MSQRPQSEQSNTKSEFEEAGEQKQLSLVKEFLLFVVENKLWWMIPILLALALIGCLVAFASTGAAPFIYTIF